MKCKTIRKTAAELVLCLALLSGASGTALAQSVPSIIITPSNTTIRPSPTPSANAQVKAGATEGYMFIIPTEINLGELAVEDDSKPMTNASVELIAKEVLIDDDESLVVTAEGSGEGGAFTLSITGHGTAASVPFKLMDQSKELKPKEVKPGETLCTFEAGKPETDQIFRGEVVQALTASAGYAGDYTGTLRFTCTIVKP